MKYDKRSLCIGAGYVSGSTMAVIAAYYRGNPLLVWHPGMIPQFSDNRL